MTLARKLARRLSRLDLEAIPSDVVETAKLHFLDALGVGLAASAGPAGTIYGRALDRLGSHGKSSVLGSARTASPADAALANGGMIHALEFDDTHMGSIVHGSATLLPAALATGEMTGASGRAILSAYIGGWETLIRIGRAAPGAFQREGFQVTVTGGCFAAAQVASRLMQASEDELAFGFGIALSQASGVFEFLTNGSTVKSLHPGWAAHSGIVAACLATSGLTGPETSFEGKRGLFSRFAGEPDAAERFGQEIETLGTTWHLREAAFKFYPCCHYIHPFLTALDALGARGVRHQDVASLLCFVPISAAPIICDDWERRLSPQSTHEMRYSLPIVLSLKMVEGRLDRGTFDQPASEAVRSLAKRIQWRPLPDDSFPDRFEATICATLHDGIVHEIAIDDVRGGPRYPATPDDILAKFRTNAGGRNAAAVDGLIETVMTMERRSVAEISSALVQLS